MLLYPRKAPMFVKFPSIESFRHLRKRVELNATYTGRDEYDNPQYGPLVPGSLPTLTFRGTTKLHGTNSGVVRTPDGEFHPQSRGRTLTRTEDNYNFAKFVLDEVSAEVWEDLFRMVFGSMCDKFACVLYGEVCGKGVQSKVGVCALDRMFVMFAARLVNEDEEVREWLPLASMVEAPDSRVFNVFNSGFFEIEIDFNKWEEAQEKLTELTLIVENNCPVAAKLGEGGIGEGIVWQCTTPSYESSQFWFKTKGEKHKGSSSKTKVEADPAKVANVAAFVEQTVTEARCLQGIDYLIEMGHPLTKKSTGAYLKWVGGDVFKEEYDVLEVSGLTRKDVGGPVANFARKWFFSYLDRS